MLTVSSQVHSALPPDVRNQMDLKVMLDYANKNYEVISQLESISLKEFTIYYSDNCKVEFKREARKEGAPIVGSETELIFKKKVCEMTND